MRVTAVLRHAVSGDDPEVRWFCAVTLWAQAPTSTVRATRGPVPAWVRTAGHQSLRTTISDPRRRLSTQDGQMLSAS